MKFYEYSQNNTGGSFIKEMGYAIIIQANSNEEADRIAESKGVYFDGCENDRDCSCCGDRWDRAYGEGTEEPEFYSKKHSPNGKPYINWNLPTNIYYKDGTTEVFRTNEE